MKAETKLAKVLEALGSQGERVESQASTILAILKESKVKTVEALDALIKQAYAANGWHTRPGAVKKGAEKRAKVPHTVRTYVWELRSAMREGLPVWNYGSFHEIRAARGKLRQVEAVKRPAPAAAHENTLADLPEMKGVRLANGDAPNGALFHDFILTYTVLEPDQRVLLARNLERLRQRYQALVPAPAAKVKKAA